MDTAKLKRMAQFIRKELIGIVEARLGIVLEPNSVERRDYSKEVSLLEDTINEIGKEQLIEKMAYTWFNRFCALRFMEVNKYTKINIVSPALGQFQPEVLAEAKMGYLDENVITKQNIEKIKGLLGNSITSKDPQNDAYKILIESYCNFYHQQMPFLFEKMDDYSELLLPDDLISGNSVIAYIREALTPENCSDIEVIGWLYQYYISEKKDEVFAELKKGKKISKENVPAATQIFTPKWIVSYMVENSVGKLWLEAHPDERLQSQFKYYLESAEQEPEVQAKLDELKNKDLKPQDIKVLDPACGSGHILVKAFDILFEIYKSQGWQENEIPEMILKNNLYGLDICDRAAQLTQFAVMMKARAFDRNIFNKVKELNICSIKDTNWIDVWVEKELLQGVKDEKYAKEQIDLLKNTFHDAKEYGSILDVKDIDLEFWDEYLNVLKQDGQIRTYTPMIKGRLPYTLKQAKIMQQKYECVIANPPYMGGKGMSAKLSEYAKKKYPMSKGDMFAIFKEVILKRTAKNCYSATINQHSWMFLSSYEQLREYFLNNAVIDTMAHLGTRAFEELAGEVVQTTTYVARKFNEPNYVGKFVKLTDYPNAKLKEEKYLEHNTKDIYTCKQNGFHSIPGSPIAYWASDRVREIFKISKELSDFATIKEGLKTADNDYFIKKWYEININNSNIKNSNESKKWIKHTKGGEFKLWYGNNEDVLNYGKELFDFKKASITGQENYFKENFTWSRISSKDISFRYTPEGSIPNMAGLAGYATTYNLKCLLGFLNSTLNRMLIRFMNPTLNYPPGTISSLPIIEVNDEYRKKQIELFVDQNIQISKDDWDSFETSWDFEQHPLLRFRQLCHPEFISGSNQQEILNQVQNNSYKVSDCFNKWKEYKQEQFNKLKSNEEELNRLFIEIYGLQDEMTPEVADKDITVALADEVREIKSLLSYAVGCMFGRYSLDEKGLAFAGGEFDSSKYKTFPADEDAVIPVLAEHMFSDDITSRFKDFLKVAFGTEHFDENLEYVASVLGKKNTETADDTIRAYFMKDFYNDHIKMYQKRPIYWMFSSSKGNFNALVYMHRYNKDTASVILNSYLRNFRDEKLKAQIENCKQIELSASTSQGDKIKASKRREELEKIVKEVTDYERDILYPLATERKEIDLDDGVKVNYLKFGKALKDFGLKAKK